MAHKLAVESEYVTADVIEISEFPEMAQRYNIFGVPKVVMNDRLEFEGALPEQAFVSQVIAAATASEPGSTTG